MTESLEATLRRLQAEREEADHRYNEALTALDRARPGMPSIPEPMLPLDGARLAELNAAWNILPGEPSAAGLRGKLAGFIWRTIGPYLQRQVAFNSILVDHINRNTEAQTRAQRQAEDLARELRGFSEQVGSVHTRLMMYLQQITAYVDTRDREAGGGALVLNAALSDLAEAQAKYRETLQAREHRYEARVSALHTAAAEFRTTIGILQQAVTTLKRELEPRIGPAASPSPASAATGSAAAPDDAFAPRLDAYKYVVFENEFRGPESVIRERQKSYLPYFEGAEADVLDVGCGRGEFIDLLNGRGIPARGIDLNSEMVEVCRSRGLDVTHADALGYLRALPDDSLGGLFAAQVVEHLEPAYLLRFLEVAGAKLRPGARMVLETLNPACWTAFFESYIRDITHRWPLHPETLRYFVLASGFTTASIEFRSPVAAEHRLQPADLPTTVDPILQDVVDVMNRNAEKVNARMFTHMDYAVVAQKA